MTEGGVTAALSAFREIWLCDFEFVANDGERVWPVCMVASEYHSGRTLRLWRDDLLKHAAAPFDVGSDSLFVSYSAAAELSCFLVLGWPLPANILDLFAEFRCNTNGLALRHGTSLIGALLYHGLPTLDARYKAAMQDKVIQGGPWSSDDERAILEYCETDVAALMYLLPKMIGGIKILSALCRGRFTKAVAHIEQEGVPIDIPTWRALLDNWE